MRPNNKFYITIIFLGLFIPAIAQQKNYVAINAKVDSFINLQMAQKGMAGLSLAVMKDGKIIHSKGYGYANLEHKVPVTNKTVFLMASVTKTFVAVATMMLVEQGKISLTDTIGKFVHDIPSHW